MEDYKTANEISLAINTNSLFENIVNFLDEIRKNEDKTVTLCKKEDFDTIIVIFDCLKACDFGSTFEKSKILAKLISILSDAVYELIIRPQDNLRPDINVISQRIKEIFKKVDFCLDFVEV